MITDLKLDLLKEGSTFTFFQVMRLLRLLTHESPVSQSAGTSKLNSIRVRPKLSLAFPPSDVDRIEEIIGEEETRFQVTVNFLGLYGVSSPLPIFYTEDLITDVNDNEYKDGDASTVREFIDIIHYRLYQLFYDCCIKYKQYLQVVEANSSQHAERLFCLLGIGEKELRSEIPDPYGLIRYIGLFTQMPRSALGLETLLSDALNGMAVSVIPCVERKVKIPYDQRMYVGSSLHRIGQNSFIGEELVDRMGKFRIRIGPLDIKNFQSFYTELDNYNTVTLLTDLYVLDPLEYDLEVILAEGEAETVSLGDIGRSRLGLNTWIFSSPKIGEVRKIYTPQRRQEVKHDHR